MRCMRERLSHTPASSSHPRANLARLVGSQSEGGARWTPPENLCWRRMKIETVLNLFHNDKIQLDRILAESQLWQKWVLVNL